MQYSDELVHAIGARLVEVLPDDVWVGRIASAEFALFFENLDVTAAGAKEQLNQYARTLKKRCNARSCYWAGTEWSPSVVPWAEP